MSKPRKPNLHGRLTALEKLAGGSESLMELRRAMDWRECMAHIVLQIRQKPDDVTALAHLLGWPLNRAAESMRRQRRIEALTVYSKEALDPDDVLDRLIDVMESHLHEADLNFGS